MGELKFKRTPSYAGAERNSEMSEPSWTDWVTAVSTALTGLFAAVGAFVAYASFRRDSRRLLPVVEISSVSPESDIGFGDFLIARVRITNRLDETLVIERIDVKVPINSRVSTGYAGVGAQNYGGAPSPAKGEADHILGVGTVGEAGSSTTMHDLSPQRTDFCTLELYIVPPREWHSGILQLEIFVSSRADTIRHKRIVVKSDATLLTMQKKVAKANNIVLPY